MSSSSDMAGSAVDSAVPVPVLDYQPLPSSDPRDQVAGLADTLKQRAVRATGWRMASHVGENCIRLLANALLAHLLSPAIFGLNVLAYTVVKGLEMFSELGIAPAIIQSKRGDDPEFLNTAWTLQVIRGSCLWLAACALAWPAAIYYGNHSLVWVLPVLSLVSVIGGFNSTAVYTLNRHLLEGKRATLDVCQNFVTRSVMIGWALVSPSVMALVAGSLAGKVFYCVASHRVIRGHRNRFHWDRDALRSLAHFGRWIFIGTVIAYFGQQSDRLLLPKLGGASQGLALLGVYGMAMSVARIPEDIAETLGGHVLYPMMAALARQDPEQFPKRMRDMRRILLRVGVAATLAVIVISPWFFRIFYDDRYAAAIWMAPLAAATVWFSIMAISASRMLMAVGATRPLAFSSFAMVCGTVGGCLAGHHFFYRWFGTDSAAMVGFVMGTTFGTICSHATLEVAMWRRRMPILRQDMVYTALVALGGAAVTLLPMELARAFPAAAGVAHVALPLLILVAVGGWVVYRTLPVVRSR